MTCSLFKIYQVFNVLRKQLRPVCCKNALCLAKHSLNFKVGSLKELHKLLVIASNSDYHSQYQAIIQVTDVMITQDNYITITSSKVFCNYNYITITSV